MIFVFPEIHNPLIFNNLSKKSIVAISSQSSKNNTSKPTKYSNNDQLNFVFDIYKYFMELFVAKLLFSIIEQLDKDK